ncbi:hypothetical protein [Calothrix sp. PCC 7507]|nr:hypothetical protein [Calothrix sp. PCC 7507]AFY34213.1 hypothetical protein Cal7507_3825 [Calothrix sp. PCC 7507]
MGEIVTGFNGTKVEVTIDNTINEVNIVGAEVKEEKPSADTVTKTLEVI